VKAFIDTNILIYAFIEHPHKQLASDIVAGGGIIGAQVLNEFTSVLRKKYKHAWAEIERSLGFLHATFDPIRPLTAALHGNAVALARDHGFAFYDALIVAASIDAGCDTLYTEDMQHGQTIGGVTLRNPFI
jgi:predicted nucleic acid-binding protein